MTAPVRGRRNGAARVQKRPHPYQAKAEALDRAAMAASAADHHAGVVGDYIIRITVFLAALLGESGHTLEGQDMEAARPGRARDRLG